RPDRDDSNVRHDEEGNPGRQGHQPPPRFCTRASLTGQAFRRVRSRKLSVGPDLGAAPASAARKTALNDEIVMVRLPLARAGLPPLTASIGARSALLCHSLPVRYRPESPLFR